MELLILYFPLMGSILSGLFGRFIGIKGSQFISTFFLLITFILSIYSFTYSGLYNSFTFFSLTPWFSLDLFHVSFGLIFDSVTVIMLIVVSSISFLVHFYSIEYMSHDPHIPRFMSYISLFTFFMLILITGDNLIQVFIGWEGVGICSYLLINFWFTRINANKSALQAILMNRIGDLGVILAISSIAFFFGSVNFSIINSIAPYLINDTILIGFNSFSLFNIISFFLFIGAIGKSAQIFLHTWLPSAMEGPTPVSALIHAATMVTAGVFLLIRFSVILEFSPLLLIFITILGALTSLFAGSIGLVQHDIKKVIAYSTCSQLGYMFIACGLSNYATSLYHLANHAFFKALLFLSAGAIIHALNDEQDMRRYGGLLPSLPLSYSMFLIGSFSLMGFPFLTGFYSKDAILELSFSHYSSHSFFSYWIASLAAIFTAIYSLRLLYLVFLSSPNYRKSDLSSESGFFMSFPLILLAFGSIFLGYLGRDLFIGLGSNFWSNSIFFSPSSLIHSEFLPTFFKLLPVLLSLSFGFFLFFFYFFNYIDIVKFQFSPFIFPLFKFLSKKWYFDKLYNDIIGSFTLMLAYNITFKIIDRGIIEILGPVGISSTISSSLSKLFLFHSGHLYHYSLIFLFSLFFLLLAIPNSVVILSSFTSFF
jgi:NADH-ubiquinone oxidoreductase chain 5